MIKELLSELIATFVLIFLSELADKTQIAIFSLGLKYKKPAQVFAGAILAHSLMDGISIALGGAVSLFFRAPLLKIGISVLFITAGAYLFFKKDDGKEKLPLIKNAFLAAFSIIFVSEFGDKSQIAAGLLAARYNMPVVVFAGTMLALATALGLNLAPGNRIRNYIGTEKAEKASAILFIIYGLAFLVI